MGFGLPSAIGAKIGRPDLEVWAVIGDGGFQMSAELATAVQENSISISRSSTTAIWEWSASGRICFTPRTTPRSNRRAELREAGGDGHHRITVRCDAIRPAIERARADTGTSMIDFVIEPEAKSGHCSPGAANSAMLHQQRYEG